MTAPMSAYARQRAHDARNGVARCHAVNLAGARASRGSYALTQSLGYWPALDWNGQPRFGSWHVADPNPFRAPAPDPSGAVAAQRRD